MSHFCVFVFHDENTSIHDLLAPYDENKKVVHKICNRNELIDKFKNEYPKYIEESENSGNVFKFCLDWYGYHSDGDDVMSDYNPESKWDWYEVGGRWSGTIPNNESSVRDIDPDNISIPYAFVTPDGNWIERGKMGWFGMSSDDIDPDEWDKKFRDFIKSIDKNIILTQVDCHI